MRRSYLSDGLLHRPVLVSVGVPYPSPVRPRPLRRPTAEQVQVALGLGHHHAFTYVNLTQKYFCRFKCTYPRMQLRKKWREPNVSSFFPQQILFWGFLPPSSFRQHIGGRGETTICQIIERERCIKEECLLFRWPAIYCVL